jgi:hypothetical protein
MDNLNINLVIILAVVVIIVVFVFFFTGKRQKTSSIIVLDKIREINEYASHELNYFENVSHEEAMRLFNHDVPFIKKGFSINVIGKIKIGINMNNVGVSIHNKDMYITIPEIKTLSHETKVSDVGFQTKNPFFQNDINDFNRELEEKRNIKENEILKDNELIEKIYADLKKKITDALLSIPIFSNRFKINYKIEIPALLIEDAYGKNEQKPAETHKAL